MRQAAVRDVGQPGRFPASPWRQDPCWLNRTARTAISSTLALPAASGQSPVKPPLFGSQPSICVPPWLASSGVNSPCGPPTRRCPQCDDHFGAAEPPQHTQRVASGSPPPKVAWPGHCSHASAQHPPPGSGVGCAAAQPASPTTAARRTPREPICWRVKNRFRAGAPTGGYR